MTVRVARPMRLAEGRDVGEPGISPLVLNCASTNATPLSGSSPAQRLSRVAGVSNPP